MPRGALCRHALGRGARGPAVSLAGAKRVSGNVALRPCRRTPMPRARSTGPCTLAMARSFAPPSRQRVRPAEPLPAGGRRPGGCSTTVPLRAADDQPVMPCVLSPGQRHAALGGEPCMVGGAGQRHGRGRPQHRPGRVVGDQASSSRTIRAYWRRLGLRITLPHKGNAHRSGPFHRASSRRREPVERLINRLQQHRRRATRYETCAAHDRAMWLIAATRLWL